LVNRKPSRGVPRLISATLALVALTSPALSAGDDGGSAVAFDRFTRTSRLICLERPAEHCVALAWRFADADGDQGLSVVELASIRATFEQWAVRYRDDLTEPERSGIAPGILIVDSIGLERLHAIYDTDQDGVWSAAASSWPTCVWISGRSARCCSTPPRSTTAPSRAASAFRQRCPTTLCPFLGPSSSAMRRPARLDYFQGDSARLARRSGGRHRPRSQPLRSSRESVLCGRPFDNSPRGRRCHVPVGQCYQGRLMRQSSPSRGFGP